MAPLATTPLFLCALFWAPAQSMSLVAQPVLDDIAINPGAELAASYIEPVLVDLPTNEFPQNQNYLWLRRPSLEYTGEVQPYFDNNPGSSVSDPTSDQHGNQKRALFGYSMTKRIHTCAFMRRLGLPIGMCLSSGRQRAPPKPQRPKPAPRKPDAYSYLENQWPVQSMLGGSIGRR